MSNMNKSDLPLITVGILNCNGLEMLKKTISSIMNQLYEPKEILVFDNGSTDGSLGYLNSLNSVCVIASEVNLGYGAGKNALARNANGAYILMFDNDIELPQNNFIELMLKNYLKLNKPAFLSPLIVDIDKDFIDTGHL